MVADYVASIVGQFGASTFHVREVVLNVILELLKGRRKQTILRHNFLCPNRSCVKCSEEESPLLFRS